MKKKIFASAAIALLLITGSCKKFLDIPPQFEFTSSQATSTLDGLQKTMTGAFNQLQSSSLYGGGIIAYSELMADFVNTYSLGDYNLDQVRIRQMNADNSVPGGMWGAAYSAIYRANVVLQYAPNFTSQNAPAVQTMRGEAYFIRGIMHFELVRIFAQPSGFTTNDSHMGVPIVLAPGTLSSGQNTRRSTVAQVYTQVEADLDSAYNLLPASPSTRASQAAAAGFLTRAYFEQHNYTQALKWANIVINNYGFTLSDSLLTPYQEQANSYSTETIFQEINAGLNVNNGPVYNEFTASIFPAPFTASNQFQVYLAGDSAANSLRYQLLYKRLFNNQQGIYQYCTRKYQYNGDNVCVMRLEEMLYDRAESNAQLGTASDAAIRADYNLTRVRAGLLPDNTTTGSAALILAIRGERDIELAMEGDRFYELKRRQMGFTEPESPNLKFDWNSPELVYPIPLQEVVQNKNMIQNPGY